MEMNFRSMKKCELSSAIIRGVIEIVDEFGFNEPEQLAFITTLLIAFCRKLNTSPINVVTEMLSFIVDMESEDDEE